MLLKGMVAIDLEFSCVSAAINDLAYSFMWIGKKERRRIYFKAYLEAAGFPAEPEDVDDLYFDCECHYRTRCFHPCVLFHEFHEKDEEEFYSKHKIYDEFVREARTDPDLRKKLVDEGLDKCVEPIWKKRKIAKLPKLPLANSDKTPLVVCGPCDTPVAEDAAEVACPQFTIAAWVRFDKMFVPPDMKGWNTFGISIDAADKVKYSINGQVVAEIVDKRHAEGTISFMAGKGHMSVRNIRVSQADDREGSTLLKAIAEEWDAPEGVVFSKEGVISIPPSKDVKFGQHGCEHFVESKKIFQRPVTVTAEVLLEEFVKGVCEKKMNEIILEEFKGRREGSMSLFHPKYNGKHTRWDGYAMAIDPVGHKIKENMLLCCVDRSVQPKCPNCEMRMSTVQFHGFCCFQCMAKPGDHGGKCEKNPFKEEAMMTTGELVFLGPILRDYTICKTVIGDIGGFEVILKVGKGGQIKACLNNGANDSPIEFSINNVIGDGEEHLLVMTYDSEHRIARWV